jgi:hypothetical protein
MCNAHVRSGFLTLLALGLLALPTFAPAGVVVQMENREPGAEGAVLSRSVLSVEGDRLRLDPIVDEEGHAPQTILFLGGEQRMLTVDHGNQWYGEMNPILLEAVKGQLAEALKEVERQLAQLPPEQRALVEERIKEQLSPRGAALPHREVRRTEETRQVGPYPAVRFEVLRDGAKERDVWVTEWSNVRGGEELRKGFEAMEGFVRRMVDTLAELPRMEEVVQRLGNNLLQELSSLPGLPVHSIVYAGGEPVQELVVVAVESRPITAESLAPPEGYTARNLFVGAQ